MTTQNTHDDQYEVEGTVVENSSAPKSTSDLDASHATLPTEAEERDNAATTENVHSEEQPSSLESTPPEINQVEEEQRDATPVLQTEEEHRKHEFEGQEAQSHEVVASVEAATEVQPDAVIVEDAPLSSHQEQEIIPLVNMAEEVRPFTAFIEEFRQAEARLQATVQETEVFHTTTVDNETTANQKSPLETKPVNEGLPEVSDETHTETTEASSQEQGILTTPEPALDSKVREEATAVAEAPETVEKKEPSTGQGEAVVNKPAERAVSPLLRPASRLRPTRHGGVRHQLREAHNETQPNEEQPQTAKREEVVNGTAQANTAATRGESTSAASDEQKAAEGATPRPARRYRFDRPASSNNNKPATQRTVAARNEEQSLATPTTVPEEAPQSANGVHAQETAKATASTTPVSEQQNGKAAVVSENAVTEGSSSASNANQDHSRRRQSHERNKEQTAPAPTPVIEASVPVAEPSEKTQESEDLPPLEYADLQKANSRRRRRHRSGTSNGVPTPAVHSAAAPQTPTPVPESKAPIQPVYPSAAAPSVDTSVTPAQYTIVSGYTVNQMNQGSEGNGPFMAPDPTPARGSLMTRDGRMTVSRSEIQRGPAPTYTHVRPASEAGVSSSALNHFANTISQAIQSQTDRMVAELHKATQTPANISVSLPPFPSNERVGVFVDVANLLYSARTLNLAVDFGKLLDFLRGNRRLIRAQAYCPTSPQPGAEQMFLQAVKGLGYRITTKNYKTFSSGAKKADLDLDLCMDVVRLVDGRAVECIVLVSGDSDFMPMLDYCSDHGVRVEVAAFDEAMSATLRQSCDLFINLSMLDEVLARV